MISVGWVEEKRVLSYALFPKPIIQARGQMMGFAITPFLPPPLAGEGGGYRSTHPTNEPSVRLALASDARCCAPPHACSRGSVRSSALSGAAHHSLGLPDIPDLY